ncbi:MAG: hypothetical protein LC803_22135 [Acidobacteria bacterium]|nr:hypothetical protein [Acidobacteriota bacterium]
MMKLREIKQSISALPPRDLAKLNGWLRALLSSQGSKKKVRGGTRQKEVLRTRRATHKTYRQEKVRCGKQGCKCANGELHGPYWYAYWSEGGKTKSEYVGKHLPETQEK